MNQEKLDAFEQRAHKQLEDLRTSIDSQVKELREDALRDAIEELSAGVQRRLTSIESRLTSLEEKVEPT